MLTENAITKLQKMQLSTMAYAFKEQLADPNISELSFEDRFGLIVDVLDSVRTLYIISAANLHYEVYLIPYLLWVSDCTQFSLFKKTYHLCAILDLFSRKIIAYKISARPSTQLITSTFKMALGSRKPEGHLVFHSDRGCQYTSYSFRKLLIENNVTQSFSKPGTPYDNGVMKSFFSSFKQEEIYRTSYRSLEDCKTHIADYMQFYNEKRPHRANNYKSPNQTEEAYYKKNPAV